MALGNAQHLVVAAPSGWSSLNSWHRFSLSQAPMNCNPQSLLVRGMHFEVFRILLLGPLGFVAPKMASAHLTAHNLAGARNTEAALYRAPSFEFGHSFPL